MTLEEARKLKPGTVLVAVVVGARCRELVTFRRMNDVRVTYVRRGEYRLNLPENVQVATARDMMLADDAGVLP